ncbi:MAG: SDR family oxidoreductase, partial [Burkholderiales bacterium]
IPLGRFGTPEEIASLVLYLASDFSNFIVGQVISPNGGQVI